MDRGASPGFNELRLLMLYIACPWDVTELVWFLVKFTSIPRRSVCTCGELLTGGREP